MNINNRDARKVSLVSLYNYTRGNMLYAKMMAIGKVMADNTVVAITICVASSGLFFISKAIRAVLSAVGTL